MIEILGIIAAIFEIAAIYLLTNKNKYGFLVGILCNISWITYTAISHNAIGLIIVSSFAFILNIKGFTQWSRNE